MESVLQFQNYRVIEQMYKTNMFVDEKEMKLGQTSIQVEIGMQEEDFCKAVITITIEIGDSTLQKSSLYVRVKVAGFFIMILQKSQDLDEKQAESFYKKNAVAILFPYVRSLISDLTSKGDHAPIILPTVNITKLMEENE